MQLPSSQGRRKHGQFQQYGSLVKQRRELRDCSQEDLAKRSETSRAHISHIEKGDYRPGPVLLANIGKALEISDEDSYALAGYIPRSELPSLRAYLFAKHHDWPEEVIDDIEKFCEYKKAKHGLSD
jgi:transcriptional regulator with XRE-family HTH domain